MELFLPVIAVAYDFAPSFSDAIALSFSLDSLFAPKFGADLSIKLLDSLRAVPSLNFSIFDIVDVNGIPMASSTFEVFDVKKYLPEIQFALDLSPSVNFAAPSFQTSDIFDALFPSSVPTVKTMGNFVKKKVVASIASALDGLFDVGVVVPTAGLTIDTPILNASGLTLGEYTDASTQVFPPVIDVDRVQVSTCDLGYDWSILTLV